VDNDDTPPAAASASTVTSRGSVGRRGAVTESQLMDAVLPGPSNDAGSTLPASITAALVRLSLSYLITDCRVPELIPVLGSQPAGDVSHKPGCHYFLPGPQLTLATLKMADTSFTAW